MDFELTPELEALRARARRFTEEELFPRELEVEERETASRRDRGPAAPAGGRRRPVADERPQGAGRPRLVGHGAGDRAGGGGPRDQRPVGLRRRSLQRALALATRSSGARTWIPRSATRCPSARPTP